MTPVRSRGQFLEKEVKTETKGIEIFTHDIQGHPGFCIGDGDSCGWYILGCPGSLQSSSKREVTFLAGLAPFWEWGQLILQCHESDTLTTWNTEQGPPGGEVIQSSAQGPIFFFFVALYWDYMDDLHVFKALPIGAPWFWFILSFPHPFSFYLHLDPNC